MTEDLERLRGDWIMGHFGEEYLYGEDADIDELYEARWALVVQHFPQPKPLKHATEDELRAQWEEHQQEEWELLQEIAEEREQLGVKREVKRRSRAR